MRNQNVVDSVANALLIIGGLNWGIIGLFNYDPVDSIFGAAISQAVFVVVGLAALYKLGVWVASKVN